MMLIWSLFLIKFQFELFFFEFLYGFFYKCLAAYYYQQTAEDEKCYRKHLWKVVPFLLVPFFIIFLILIMGGQNFLTRHIQNQQEVSLFLR